DHSLIIPAEPRARAFTTRAYEAIQIDTIGNDFRPLPKCTRHAVKHRRRLDDDGGGREPGYTACYRAHPGAHSARNAAFLTIDVTAAVAHEQWRAGTGAHIGYDCSGVAKMSMHKVKLAGAQGLQGPMPQADVVATSMHDLAFDATPPKAGD